MCNSPVLQSALMSRIERKYCSISTSYLAGLFQIFILLHIWLNCMCFGDFLPTRTLCDTYHKKFEFISVQSWTYLVIQRYSLANLYRFLFRRIKVYISERFSTLSLDICKKLRLAISSCDKFVERRRVQRHFFTEELLAHHSCTKRLHHVLENVFFLLHSGTLAY